MRPNLPEKPVKKAFVSRLMPAQMKNELKLLGIECVHPDPAVNITGELRYHPDIVTLNVSEGVWYVEKSNEQMFDFGELKRLDFDQGNVYPYDCALNCVVAGGKVICGRSAPKELFRGMTVIEVNQGYAKCSTIPLNESAFITSDKSIYKALVKNGCDVLLTNNDGIMLDGYDCGFIGGCSGKVSEKLLVFTGDIKKHKDHENIKSFCANHQIDIYSLGNNFLYDHGGILPIC